MLNRTWALSRTYCRASHHASRTHLRLPPNSTQLRCLSSTVKPAKTSSWKSLVLRLGLAGSAVYYYNTADIFRPQPILLHTGPEVSDAPDSRLESLAASKPTRGNSASPSPSPSSLTLQSADTPLPQEPNTVAEASNLEAEADQQGAFNPETGEINWDCPCLGGMAHGPCGEDFKTAFSCFMFSEVEPKGMDCVDKFKSMQDCFRAHPNIYAAELEDDAEDGPEPTAKASSEAAPDASDAEAEVPQAVTKTSHVRESAQSQVKEAVGTSTEILADAATQLKAQTLETAAQVSDTLSQAKDTALDHVNGSSK